MSVFWLGTRFRKYFLQDGWCKTSKAKLPCNVDGVTIDNKFQYDEHIKSITRTIAWKLCGITRIKRWVNLKTRWRLIQTYILPHFDYVSSILIFSSATSRRRLEGMYGKCIRHAVRDYKSPLPHLQTILGTLTLNERQYSTLFRLMKAVEISTKRLKDSTCEEFLHNYQFCNGYAPVALLELFSAASTRAHRSVFIQPR